MGSWRWFACGKHPVAGDFFQTGLESPLARHFKWWMEKGYETWINQQKNSLDFTSWRFWAQGSKTDELVLGLVRDSGDRRGRPFPILFIGSGVLKSWAGTWELLPLVCDPAWTQIEHLAVKRVESIEGFKHELAAVRPPAPNWSSAQKAYALGAQSLDQGQVRPGPIEGQGGHPASYAFSIQENESRSDLLLVTCHSRVKNLAGGPPPQSVFMGGVSNALHMMSFYRSVTVSDYVNLWSLR